MTPDSQRDGQNTDRAQNVTEAANSAPDFRGKTCFVIMPFGRSDRPAPGDLHSIDELQHFNAVYDFICEIVEGLRIKPLRSDRRAEALPIHGKMLTDIIDADLAIVDITNHNANVFYELGVRHTARRHSTVLIGQKGTLPPFNLSGVRVIGYDLATPQSTDESRTLLREAIIANLSARVTDSLVHSLLPGLNLTRPQQVLESFCEVVGVRYFPSARQGAKTAASATKPDPGFTLGVIKGDLVDVDMVDVWVNPESTRMEMARIHDNSVSAFVRYHGARKDASGNVLDDIVHRQLKGKVGRANVEAGRVIVTRPGELRKMNVAAIFHVAAQHGEPCNGYHTVRTYRDVVSNSLAEMDRLNKDLLARFLATGSTRPLRSILFPLLGTRNTEYDPIDVTVRLINEARKYLSLWPGTQISSIYFLAYTKRDLELCEAAFQRLQMPLPAGDC